MDRDFSPQQLRRRRLARGAKALLALAAIATLAWSTPRFLRPSVERADLRIATVERGPLEATVTATGTIVPGIEQTVSSPVGAEVLAVPVALGERVKRGDVIMELDTRATKLALVNLEEQLALKQAELRSQDLQRADAIRQAKAQRELLAIDLESRQVRLSRLQQLDGSGAVSDADLLEARLDVKRTKVEIAQTDDEITSLEGRRDADHERLELDYSILEKQRDDQARRVAMSTVKAPLDGVVTSLVHDAGSVVAEGQALATIAAEDSFSVEASVSDFYGPQLRPGQRARIRSSAIELEGTLNRILPSADSSSLDLFIELDDPAAPAFHTNLRVDVEIVTAEKPDVLKVRRGPALEGAGIEQLYVVDGDRAVRRPVRLGSSERNEVEIVGGLEVGDEVIVSDTSAFERLAEVRIK
ncbi:MAG TPA: HlyD family efflux transporter periplasmic adaptor subunit [Gammaproteobacteria bacterium]|nr:HlyD family efflux transporter periplasmic adaptor subunit [Gammaproteobacteria bacterium]